MPRRSRWTTRAPSKDGLWTIELLSWKYFHDFVRQEMLHYSHYVWRGQRDSSWRLQTSLDRALKGKLHSVRPSLAADHLERFKYASRGRRGPTALSIQDDNDWWALGQHHGLATPLLDWTESPFVALYFAFEETVKPTTGFRSVWALGKVEDKNREIVEAHRESGPPPVLEYVRPFQDDNNRLLTQAAVFTRAPLGATVDEWVLEHFAGVVQQAALIHLKIPEKDRADCLCTLNRMNINHKTLFPDLSGSAEHCNKGLAIRGY